MTRLAVALVFVLGCGSAQTPAAPSAVAPVTPSPRAVPEPPAPPLDARAMFTRWLDAFNAAFVEKLATYGLRRSMSFEDREDLAAIAKDSKAQDYRLRAVVEAFVLSDLFQKR